MQQSDEDNHQQSNPTKINKIRQAFKHTCMSYGVRRSYCELILSSLAVIKTENRGQKYRIVAYGLADEMNLLKKGESRAQKVQELLREREEILRLLRLELMGRRNQKLLKVQECCQYLQHFRMYNLLILEHLQSLRNEKMVGDTQYQNQIITGLLFDSDFIRLSQLRKYIQFSKSYDPLFMIPLKKFWNLQRTSDDNKRVIIDLFTISEDQRERLQKSDQYLRQFLKKHEHKLKKEQQQTIYEVQKSDKDHSFVLSKSKSSEEDTLPKFILPSIGSKATAHYSQEKSNNIYDIIKVHHQRQKQVKSMELKRIKDLKAKRRSTTQANQYAKKQIQLSIQDLRSEQKLARRKAYILDNYNKDEPQSEYKRKQKSSKPFFRNQILPLPVKGTLIEQKPSKQSQRSKIHLTQTSYNQILDILKQKSQISLPKQHKQQKEQRNKTEDERQHEISKPRSNKYRKNKIVVRSQQSKLKQTVSHGHWIRQSNQKIIDEGIIYPNISNFNDVEQEQAEKLLIDKVSQLSRVSGLKSKMVQQDKRTNKPQIQKFNNPIQMLQNIRGKKEEIELNLMQKKVSVSPQPNNQYIQSDNKRTSRNRGILQSKQSPVKQHNLQIQSNFNQTIVKQPFQTKKQPSIAADIPIIKRIKKNLGFISSNVNYSFGTQNYGNNAHNISTPTPQPRPSPKKNRIISEINQIIRAPPSKPSVIASPVIEKRQIIVQTEIERYEQNVKPSKMLKSQSNNSGENNRLLQVQLGKKDLSDSFCQTQEIKNNNALLITDNSKYATKTEYMKNTQADKNQSITDNILLNDPPIVLQNNTKQSKNNISMIAEAKPKRQINIFDETQKHQQYNISLLNQSLNRSKQSIIRPDEQKIRLNLTKQQQSILQKCTFQSKSHLQQQLQFKIRKYSGPKSQKIIQYTNKHYFMNRHIILSTCSYNNEVISYSLSSPHLTQEHRYVFIIYLEVIKKEFHNILNKFLATFVKYMFFNDPTDFVIYLQIKGIFQKSYVECFESINNYSGVIKTPIKSPYFDDQSYIFERKDIKCNKVEDYTTIFNTLTLFMANKKSKAPLQSLKLNQLYISSSYLNFIHKSIKQNQGRYFPKLKDLQKYLQSQTFPTFKQKTLQQGIILHQNLLQDCLTKIRFYVYSNFCYFTIQPPYTLLHEGKEVNFVLIATTIKNRYFVLADKIYEESENVDIYKQMKNALFGKKVKDLFYTEKSKGKIISCPLFQKAVQFSLSEDVYGIVSFSLNWKDYLKGTRYFREDGNTFQLIGPFLCGYLQLDEQGKIHHLYSTIINDENLQK